MALIKCTAPIAALAAASPGATHASVVPIEQTGKTYKGQMLGGAALCCIGIVVAVTGAPGLGGIMLFGGVVWYLIARFGAWWNHG